VGVEWIKGGRRGGGGVGRGGEVGGGGGQGEREAQGDGGDGGGGGGGGNPPWGKKHNILVKGEFRYPRILASLVRTGW